MVSIFKTCRFLFLVVLATSLQATTQERIADIKAGGKVGASVVLRGVVTSLSGWHNSFFLQDATGGISVDGDEHAEWRADQYFHAGEQVEVTGTVQAGFFAPSIMATRVIELGNGNLPKPIKPSDSQLARGQLDSQRIELTGVIHSARIGEVMGNRVLLLDLRTASRAIEVHVLKFSDGNTSSLVDSVVTAKGVCGTIFNDRRQIVGVRLFVPTLEDIRVDVPATDPFQLPLTPVASLKTFASGVSEDHRIRISGIVTHQVKGSEIFLENTDGSTIRLRTNDPRSFEPGTMVTAVGFLSTTRAATTLEDVAVRPIGRGAALKPIPISASHAIRTMDSFRFAPYDGRLVEVEGEVRERLPGTNPLVWLVHDGKTIFAAELDATADRDLQIEPGSKVRLTGICVAEYDESGIPTTFRILLRSEKDVEILRVPLVTFSHLLVLTSLLFLFSGGLLIWILQRPPGEPAREQAPAPTSSSRVATSERAAQILGAAVFGIGMSALLGWIFDIHFLKVMRAGVASVEPLGAAVFIVAGAASFLDALKSRKCVIIARLCAVLVAGIGLWCLVQAANGPGQMSFVTALGISLWSAGFWLVTREKWVAAGQCLAIIMGSLGLLNLTCFFYDIQAVQGLGLHTAAAPRTAACLFLLSIALLQRKAGSGIMATISADGPGGVMARRMIPAALLIPGILGWIRWQGQLAGFYDGAFGLALYASANMISFSFLIWNSAAILNRIERERMQAKLDLQASDDVLRKRTEQLELVFREGSIGDWTLDVASGEVTAHRTVWGLYGEPDRSGSAPATWFQSRQHPEDCLAVGAALQDALDGNSGFDIEFRVIWPDGSVHWLSCRGTVVRDSEGRPICAHGINIDITARKEMEQAVKESERQFRVLADAMPQIVWTATPDGRPDYYNERWYEFAGFERNTIDNRAWLEIVHPDDSRGMVDGWRASVESGKPYEFEYRLWDRRHNCYRWYLARSAPVFDDQGKVTRWFGTVTDVDDLKRAREEIRALNVDLGERVRERSAQLFESEQRMLLMIRGINDYAIYMLDADGTVTTWNSGAERLFGYTDWDVLGKHFAMFYTAEDVESGCPDRDLAEALEKGEFQVEQIRVRKDGGTFWASVLITPVFDELKRLRGFSKIERDVTERKNAIEAIREAQEKAESANRAKSAFLAAMSHEIRTPMNGVIGMTDLLLDTRLTAEQLGYVEAIRSSGAGLLTIINDVLDFSKIEAGKMDLEDAEFDLQSLIEESVDLIAAAATQKNLSISVDIAQNTPFSVIGDSARLRQILLNLLSNAVKFTDDGSVALSVSRVAANDSATVLRFAIRDTGIGLTSEQQAKLFQAFTQADRSTTRRFGGTGLGLSIVKRLVELMGGTIGVSSEIGKGSTFWFNVCVQPGVAAEPGAFTGRSALLIDDHPNSCIATRRVLERLGMRVLELSWESSGSRKWLTTAGLSDAPISLLIAAASALKEPSELNALRRMPQLKNCPVLVLGSPQDWLSEDFSSALQDVRYVPKPVRCLPVVRAVQSAIDGHHSFVQINESETARIGLGGADILLVEDNEINKLVMRGLLDKLGCRVETAGNGLEACAAVERCAFDLILMDCHMPVMDGLEATRLIREKERGAKRTPIIALTAGVLKEERDQCFEAGMDDFLSKPIARHEMELVLANWIQAARAIEGSKQPIGRQLH